MEDVPHPVLGIDNLGNREVMMPGGMYRFPGQTVFELPLKGDNMKMKKGGAAAGHAGRYWNGERWVSSAGGATYDNGVFYATGGKYSRVGGPTFMPGGTGPLFDYGGPTAMHPHTHPFAMDTGWGGDQGLLEEYAQDAMKKGGIYIKPSKRGTFTAAASKHGKSVQGFASQVLANKENYSPAMVKKANFARNAAKWHHEFGGAVPGADLVHPFGMDPGSGMGSGLLEEYAADTMKRGGRASKRMTPQQQMMMQQMAQDRQMPMNMPAPMAPPMGMPGMQGQPMQGQPMMMRGGKPCLECGGKTMQNGGDIPMSYYYAIGGMYQQGGDTEADTDEMKKGGHWIQGAVNPKHKGYSQPQYQLGGTYEVDNDEYNRLKSLGYKIKEL